MKQKKIKKNRLKFEFFEIFSHKIEILWRRKLINLIKFPLDGVDFEVTIFFYFGGFCDVTFNYDFVAFPLSVWKIFKTDWNSESWWTQSHLFAATSLVMSIIIARRASSSLLTPRISINARRTLIYVLMLLLCNQLRSVSITASLRDRFLDAPQSQRRQKLKLTPRNFLIKSKNFSVAQ